MGERKRLMIQDVERADPIQTMEDHGNWTVFSDNGSIHPCVGCFGCWVKTPGRCVIRDAYGDMGTYLAQNSGIVLVSRCCFGGPSPFVKNVLDRSIPYLHPYFKIQNGEMHHRQRYQKTLDLDAIFYGKCFTPEEKETARDWIKAIAVNLHGKVGKVLFEDRPPDWRELLRTLP